MKIKFTRSTRLLLWSYVAGALMVSLLPASAQTFHGASIQKSVAGPNGDFLTPLAHPGDTITYIIRVRNIDEFGDQVTVTNIFDTINTTPVATTTGNLLGSTVTLNPNDFITVTNTFQLPNECTTNALTDLATAQGQDLHNGPGGTGTPLNYSVSFPATIAILCPNLCIGKTCTNGVGETGSIGFTISVTNCGNTLLTNVVVTDTINGQPFDLAGPMSLDVGQVTNVVGSYIPSSPCSSTDFASVSGTDALGLTTNATASATCSNLITSCLGITKTCDAVSSNGVVNFSITVTNCGNVTVTNVTVADSQAGNVIVGASLAPGGTTSFSGTYPVPQGFCGTLTNVAIVTGTDICGNAAPSATNSCVTAVNCAPLLCITKEIACFLGQTNGSALCGTFSTNATGVKVGDQWPHFCYSITVSNCGPVALTNVLVTDDTFTSQGTGPVGIDLAVGGTANFSFVEGVGTTTTNTATATGQSAVTGEATTPVQAQAVANVLELSIACQKLVSVDGSTPAASADIPADGAAHAVSYTTVVSNTSPVALNITVSDTQCGSSSGITLDAGASTTVTLCTTNLTCPLATNVNTVTVVGTLVQTNGGPAICDFNPGTGLPQSVTNTCQSTLNCKSQFTGCTPGFFKNCTGQWCTNYTQNETLTQAGFVIPSSCYGTLGSTTLINALSLKGGSTCNGAAQILLRAATAAILNACNQGITYPLTTGQIIDAVNTALATCNGTTCDRNAILTLAGQLDGFNNAPAGCPLRCLR